MARIVKDDIDRFFQYNIDLATRTIYMGDGSTDAGGVDTDLAQNMIKALHILDNNAPNGDKPINIIMNNPGGDEYHGMAIYDAIRACKNSVTIKVFGHAMSMGSIILQAADHRIMAPNSVMMIHYGTWAPPEDHPKIVYSWAQEGKRFDKWMIDLYLEKIREKHPKFSRKKVDEMCNFDKFISAKEAVDLGLADEVL